MSGGVDSSVAAALLVEARHDVTGVTMQLWPSGEEEGGCCSVDAVRDAKRVCDLLGIPHYALNFRDSFERSVVTPYLDAYVTGTTPNPCIECNDRLKFSELLAKVAAQGADMLATGHYARILSDSPEGPVLGRAVDSRKDQSYFLYRLTRAQMARVIFPLGELTKADVRAMAARLGLHVHDKRESQDVCFAPSGHEALIRARRPKALEPGSDRRPERSRPRHASGARALYRRPATRPWRWLRAVRTTSSRSIALATRSWSVREKRSPSGTSRPVASSGTTRPLKRLSWCRHATGCSPCRGMRR